MNRSSVHWNEGLECLGVEGTDLTGLVSASPEASIFNTWEWIRCAADSIPAGRELHVLRIERDGRLAACLPLTYGMETVHGLPVRSVRLLGDPLSDRVPLLIDGGEDLCRLLLDALVGFQKPWDVIVLSELPEDGRLRKRIGDYIEAGGARPEWRHCSRAPAIRLDFESREQLRSSYSRSLSVRLRRSRKRLEAAGSIRFLRSLPSPDQVDSLLAELKEVEDASWKGMEGVGIFSTDDRFRFFRNFSVKAASKGWLDVGKLYLDGRLISYRYGFRYNEVFLDYNLAYHQELSDLSPGRILLEEMIESSLDCGLKAVDASRGSIERPNQLAEWTDRYIDHYQLWIFGKSLRGRLMQAGRTRIRPALERLRTTLKTRRRMRD